jgi:hypothetical protein
MYNTSYCEHTTLRDAAHIIITSIWGGATDRLFNSSIGRSVKFNKKKSSHINTNMAAFKFTLFIASTAFR